MTWPPRSPSQSQQKSDISFMKTVFVSWVLYVLEVLMELCPLLCVIILKTDQSNVKTVKNQKPNNNSSCTKIQDVCQQPVCASVSEESSVKTFDSRYLEVTQPLLPSPGLQSSSTLICSISESYKLSSLWDLYENKQAGREAAAMTSRKKTESDQKHNQIERRVSEAFYHSQGKCFISGNLRLKI